MPLARVRNLSMALSMNTSFLMTKSMGVGCLVPSDVGRGLCSFAIIFLQWWNTLWDGNPRNMFSLWLMELWGANRFYYMRCLLRSVNNITVMNMDMISLKRKTKNEHEKRIHWFTNFILSSDTHPTVPWPELSGWGGAKPEILEAAKRIKCDSCDRVRTPKDPPRVGVRKADQLNERVGVDLFFLQDCQNPSRSVLSMVDYATSYHLLRLVPKRSGKEVAALFAEAWVGTFGAPKELVHDQGSEFRTDFDELLEQCGTLSTVIPVETHWHGGMVERHGSGPLLGNSLILTAC